MQFNRLLIIINFIFIIYICIQSIYQYVWYSMFTIYTFNTIFIYVYNLIWVLYAKCTCVFHPNPV